MPACDALVVCCPAYLLSVAGRATLSCGVGGLFQRGRVMGVWTQFHVGLAPKERDTSSSRRRDDKRHLFRTLAAAADLWRCFKGIPHRFIHRDGRRGCPCARYERRGELFAKLDRIQSAII